MNTKMNRSDFECVVDVVVVGNIFVIDDESFCGIIVTIFTTIIVTNKKFWSEQNESLISIQFL